MTVAEIEQRARFVTGKYRVAPSTTFIEIHVATPSLESPLPGAACAGAGAVATHRAWGVAARYTFSGALRILIPLARSRCQRTDLPVPFILDGEVAIESVDEAVVTDGVVPAGAQPNQVVHQRMPGIAVST